MPERKVATVEYLEPEAIGLLWWARLGAEAARAFGLQSPEGTTPRDADRAEKKLTQAVGAEQGTGGRFDQGERIIDAVRQPPEWARR